MKKILLFLFIFVSVVFANDKSIWEEYLKQNDYLLTDCTNENVKVVDVIRMTGLPCQLLNPKNPTRGNYIQGKYQHHVMVFYTCPAKLGAKKGIDLYYNDEGEIGSDLSSIKCLPPY